MADQVRGSAHVAATAVIVMVTMSSMLFQSQLAEAAAHQVTWAYGTTQKDVTYKTTDTINFKNSDNLPHNVVKVTPADFANCKTGGAQPVKDQSKVTLAKGANYFICGTPGHCLGGKMKIKITGN